MPITDADWAGMDKAQRLESSALWESAQHVKRMHPGHAVKFTTVWESQWLERLVRRLLLMNPPGPKRLHCWVECVDPACDWSMTWTFHEDDWPVTPSQRPMIEARTRDLIATADACK